jgi:hypothetical protein
LWKGTLRNAFANTCVFAEWVSRPLWRPSLFGLECAAFEGFFFCGHYTRPALRSLVTTTHICYTRYFYKITFFTIIIYLDYYKLLLIENLCNNFAAYISFKDMRPSLFGLECAAFEGFFSVAIILGLHFTYYLELHVTAAQYFYKFTFFIIMNYV